MSRTLETLRVHQGPHGEIPSNVALGGDVSYGSLVGRADAPLWYVIGCIALTVHEPRALERHEEAMRQSLRLCGAWEYNNRGLIYVPMGGSWADEYILHGYVLHVQLLYLWALRGVGSALGDSALTARARNLEELLETNFRTTSKPPERPYHPNAIDRLWGSGNVPSYWLAAFHPGGYETVFDGLANGLALLLGLGGEESVMQAVAESAGQTGSYLTPAFYPPIMPGDSRWPELERYYLHTFNNRPWEYHNGGQWAMVTGFLAAGLARCGAGAHALRLADAIDEANARGNWGFFEFHHGLSHQPLGVRETAWSAAGAVIAHQTAREGKRLV